MGCKRLLGQGKSEELVSTPFREVTVKEQGIGDINSKLEVLGFIFVCMEIDIILSLVTIPYLFKHLVL